MFARVGKRTKPVLESYLRWVRFTRPPQGQERKPRTRVWLVRALDSESAVLKVWHEHPTTKFRNAFRLNAAEAKLAPDIVPYGTEATRNRIEYLETFE